MFKSLDQRCRMIDKEESKEILELVKLALESGITKEEFIKFLEEQKVKK